MAITISSLTSSFASSLSFSSHISQKPNASALSFSPSHKSRSSYFIVTSSAATTAELDLRKYVKKELPGGFAAQPIYGTGRRKCAIARVILKEGTGKFIINYREANEYLQGNPLWLQYIKVPLATVGEETTYDVFVKAQGGGLSGQAQAISLGIARALLKINEDHRAALRQEGLLTRDARVVERKKPGLKKARKAPQFSKR